MSEYKHPVAGFIPGKHCTEASHIVKNELAALPSVLHQDSKGRKLYCCDACLPNILAWLRRSDAAKRGVETRRKAKGKRAPR